MAGEEEGRGEGQGGEEPTSCNKSHLVPTPLPSPTPPPPPHFCNLRVATYFIFRFMFPVIILISIMSFLFFMSIRITINMTSMWASVRQAGCAVLYPPPVRLIHPALRLCLFELPYITPVTREVRWKDFSYINSTLASPPLWFPAVSRFAQPLAW